VLRLFLLTLKEFSIFALQLNFFILLFSFSQPNISSVNPPKHSKASFLIQPLIHYLQQPKNDRENKNFFLKI
jgi:hypothetical protein